MNGSEADEEWSDEERVRSKYHTDTEPEEDDDDEVQIMKKAQQPLRNRMVDHSDELLNRIDDEIQGTAWLKRRDQPPSQRGEDEYKKKTSRKRNVTTQTVPHAEKCPASTLHDPSLSNGGSVVRVHRDHEDPTSNIMEEGDENEGSDLDSLAAEQLEAKFKEIMSRKKGGFLDDLRSRILSDQDALQTEDGENSFHQILNFPPPDSAMTKRTRANIKKSSTEKSLKKESHQKNSQTPAIYNSDLESIMTEDFESKFNDLIIRPFQGQVKGASVKRKVDHRQKAVIAVNHQKVRSSNSTPAVSFDPYSDPYHDVSDGFSVEQTIDAYEPTDDEVARNAREIEIESVRIQREINQERRAKMSPAIAHSAALSKTTSLSPRRSHDGFASPTSRSRMKCAKSPVTLRTSPKQHLSSLDDQMEEGFNKPNLLWRDEESDFQSHDDLQHLTIKLRDTKDKLENSRNQLLLTETKRDNALSELEKVTHELNLKRKKMKTFDAEVRIKLEEMRQVEAQCHDINDMKEVLRERDQLLLESRTLGSIKLERDELLRQLETSREDLFREQKTARSILEESQEEIESLKQKLADVSCERDGFCKNIIDVEARLNEMEQTQKDLVEEKTEAVKVVKEQALRESFDLMRRSTQEVESRDSQLKVISEKLAVLMQNGEEKDQAIAQLKRQCQELSEALSHEREQRKSDEAIHIKTMQSFSVDADVAMVQLREKCFLEKQKSLESLRDQLEQDKKDSLVKVEERWTQKISDLENTITIRDKHIESLESQVANFNGEKRTIIENLKEENKESMRETLMKEREMMNQERDYLLHRERESVLREMSQKEMVSQEEVEKKEKQVMELKEKVASLKHDLDEQKQVNRQSMQEKLVAVTKAKDAIRVEKQQEFDKIKDHLVQEHKKEREKLTEKVKGLEQEVKKLRGERITSCQKEKQQTTALDRTERTLVHEINEECRRTASVLGLSPRKVCLSKVEKAPFRNTNNIERRSTTRSPTMQALANLRGCTEELRSHVLELRQQVETEKIAVTRASKDKEESIENIRRQMEREKTHELEMLKERLVKEHMEELKKMRSATCKTKENNLQVLVREKDSELKEMQRGIHAWKEDVAQKFAEKFQYELNREMERRQCRQTDEQKNLEHMNATQQEEIERLKMELKSLALDASHSFSLGTDPSLYYPRSRSSTTNHISRLSKFSGSVPDISHGLVSRSTADISPKTRDIGHLPIASTTSLSQKLEEMDRLQLSLNHQSSELRQLERTYNDLQNHYTSLNLSPSSPRSPSSHLLHDPATSTLRRAASSVR